MPLGGRPQFEFAPHSGKSGVSGASITFRKLKVLGTVSGVSKKSPQNYGFRSFRRPETNYFDTPKAIPKTLSFRNIAGDPEASDFSEYLETDGVQLESVPAAFLRRPRLNTLLPIEVRRL
jgi:hypothetical protein